MARFVAAECLIGAEGLVADRACIGELERGWRRRRRLVAGRQSGGGAASSEHDEAEGEVFLLGDGGGWAVLTGALGAGALGPWLEGVSFRLVDRERCCGANWGVQGFEGHRLPTAQIQPEKQD